MWPPPLYPVLVDSNEYVKEPDEKVLLSTTIDSLYGINLSGVLVPVTVNVLVINGALSGDILWTSFILSVPSA